MMAWEASSTDVVFPSAELLQAAYEAVRPRLRPEDVPAALTRDVGPGKALFRSVSLYLVHVLLSMELRGLVLEISCSARYSLQIWL